MNAVTYSQARQDLAKTMDKVCDDHSPVIITRKGQRSVVMISLEDYQALEETAYLLSSRKTPEGSWSPLLRLNPVAADSGSEGRADAVCRAYSRLLGAHSM